MEKEEEISEIKYPTINSGKKFKAGIWTYRKHLQVQEELKKFEKELDKDDLNRKFENLVILKGLEETDTKFKEENIFDMHPNDRASLFLAIYMSGSKGVRDENFPKKIQKSSNR